MISSRRILKTEWLNTFICDDQMQQMIDDCLVGKVYMDGIVLSAKLINRGRYMSSRDATTYSVLNQIDITTYSIPSQSVYLCKLLDINIENFQEEMKSYQFAPVMPTNIVNVSDSDDDTYQAKLQSMKDTTVCCILDMELDGVDSSVLDSLKVGDLVNIQVQLVFKFVGEDNLPLTAKIMRRIPILYFKANNCPILKTLDPAVWKKTSHLFDHGEPISGQPVDGKIYGLSPIGYVTARKSDLVVDYVPVDGLIKNLHQNWLELCYINAEHPVSELTIQIMNVE